MGKKKHDSIEPSEGFWRKITKRKQFALRPMTSEDAILQLEMLGHDFFVYLDSDTNSVCVVYKRYDGGYGLLEPEY